MARLYSAASHIGSGSSSSSFQDDRCTRFLPKLSCFFFLTHPRSTKFAFISAVDEKEQGGQKVNQSTRPLKALLLILASSLLLICSNSPLAPLGFLLLGGNTDIYGGSPRGLQTSSGGKAQQGNATALCVGRETQGGVWEELEKEYAWHHPITNKPGGQNKTFVMTKHPHWNPEKDRHNWETNGRSVVFYGCSHIRELYFEFIRMNKHWPFWTTSAAGQLTREVTWVSASGLHPTHLCDTASIGGLPMFGIDLVNCGQPTFRMVPELAPNVAIGFKGYLYTPVSDRLFVHFLAKNGLRNPDVMIMDVGIWGAAGARIPGNIMTAEQEFDSYQTWLHDTFPTTSFVWVFGGANLDARLLPRISMERSFLIRKDMLMPKTKDQEFPCKHGCAGPVLRVIALLIREWLLQPAGIDADDLCVWPQITNERLRAPVKPCTVNLQ